MKYYLLTITVVLLSSMQSFSQNSGETELGSWYMYTGTHKLSDKWNLKSLMQIRTYETVKDFNIFFVMAGTSYKANKNLSVGLNYGFLRWDRSFEDTDNPDTIEHRINESITLSNNAGNFSFANRLAVDHRFIDNKSSYETQHRLRYKLGVKHPINKKLYISVYDEIIYNLDVFRFQQNRLFGALGLKLSPNFKFELGYLRWSFKTRSFNRLQIGVILKTDWSKKTIKS